MGKLLLDLVANLPTVQVVREDPVTRKEKEQRNAQQVGVQRANWVRAACLQWMKDNQPRELKLIIAEGERRYPPGKRGKELVDLGFMREEEKG
jgi:hypothetical protein